MTTAGALVGISADGNRLAYVDAASNGDCGGVRIWTVSTRETQRLNGKSWCPGVQTSTGTGLVGPALAGSRALWLTYTGGNDRDWTLWTSTAGATSPKQIRTVTRDADDQPPVVLGPGDQNLLPYGFDTQVVVLRSDGSRRFDWNAPARVAAVAAGSSRVAVLLSTGVVDVLSDTGSVLERHRYDPNAVKAIRASGADLVVLAGATLEDWNAGSKSSRTLPTGSRLQDVVGGMVLYVTGTTVRALRLADGKDVALRSTGTTGASAELESGSGLFVASGKNVVYALTYNQVVAKL